MVERKAVAGEILAQKREGRGFAVHQHAVAVEDHRLDHGASRMVTSVSP